MRVGVIGVGIMGGAMATNLLKAGHEVIGFDVDPSKVEALAGVGLVAAASPAAVADSSEVVVLSLPSVPALDEVAATLAAHPREGLICLETGTLPLDAKEKARSVLAGAGIELMDVPLSGTGLQAADATLVVLASGSGTAFEKARPVFDAIGRSTHYLGEFGNGSKMKYIANLLVAVHNLATAEAHALGIAAGMDPALVQEVMEDGVGSSKIFEIRGPMMVADDYPPAARLDIIAKDAKLIAEFARLVGAPTPLLDTSIEYYEAASSSGLGDLDAAALCRFLEQSAGLAR
jgi:3-hydroxyisobutyrate dehydrogenase-like beta-hydroxyacid dehydrogenase